MADSNYKLEGYTGADIQSLLNFVYNHKDHITYGRSIFDNNRDGNTAIEGTTGAYSVYLQYVTLAGSYLFPSGTTLYDGPTTVDWGPTGIIVDEITAWDGVTSGNVPVLRQTIFKATSTVVDSYIRFRKKSGSPQWSNWQRVFTSGDLDYSLSNPDGVAPAASVGQAISSMTKAIFPIEIDNLPFTWELGTLSATAANLSNSKAVRTINRWTSYLPKTLRFSITSTRYVFNVYYYHTVDGSNVFLKAAKQKYDSADVVLDAETASSISMYRISLQFANPNAEASMAGQDITDTSSEAYAMAHALKMYYLTDTTLSVENAIPDSKVVGDKLNSLKHTQQDINSFIGHIDSELGFTQNIAAYWAVGAIYNANGNDASNSRAVRMINRWTGGLPRAMRFSVSSDEYRFNVFYYSGTPGAWTFISAAKPGYTSEDVILVPENIENIKSFRVAVMYADPSTHSAMSDSDFQNTSSDAYLMASAVKVNYITDTTLSIENAIPDSKAVGDMLRGAIDVIKDFNNVTIAESSANGATYSMSNGVFHVSAENPTSATIRVNVTGSTSTVLTWLKRQGPITVEYFSTNPNVKIALIAYHTENDTTMGDVLFGGASGSSYGGVLNISNRLYKRLINDNPDYKYNGTILRLIISKGFVGEAECRFRITSATSPSTEYALSTSSPSYLRVMQNNIGRFTWGDTNANPVSGEIGSVFIKNYRKFYAKYMPDVVGLQEYKVNVDSAPHRTKESIFDGIYVHGFEDEDRQLGFFSNKRVLGCTFFDLKSTTSPVGTCRWCLAEIMVGDKLVAVATGALGASNGDAGALQRKEQFANLIQNYLADYEYAIILVDMNSTYYYDNSGNITDKTIISTEYDSTTDTTIEINPWHYDPSDDAEEKTDSNLKKQLDFAKEQGYKVAHELGGYWGALSTYISHDNYSTPSTAAGIKKWVRNWYQVYDNVIVKGNIKIRNFEVLTDAQRAINPNESDPHGHPYKSYLDKKVLNRTAEEGEYVWLASDHLPVIADLVIY